MNISELLNKKMALRHERSGVLIAKSLDDGDNPEYTANLNRRMMDIDRKFKAVCAQVVCYHEQLKQDNQTEMEYEL